MSKVRILGDPEGSFDGERLDEWRTWRATSSRYPLCNAPFGVLSIGPDGDVRPCAHSRVSLGNVSTQSPAQLWKGEALGAIRADLAGGTFQRDVCGRCVNKIEGGLYPQSPPIREYDSVDPIALEDEDAPPSVVAVDFGREGSAPLPETALEDVKNWLPALRRLELSGDGALASAGVERLLGPLRHSVAAGRSTPDVLRRTSKVTDLDGTLAALAGIPRATIRIQVEEEASPATLRGAVARAREKGVGAEAEFVIGPSNWFDLEGILDACHEGGARLFCRVEDRAGSRPLLALPPDEIRVVCVSTTAVRDRFAEPVAGVSQREFDQFIEECRAIHRERTEEGLWNPTKVSETAGLLRLPPWSHGILRSETATLGFLGRLLRIYRSPAVAAWIRALASETTFVESARRRFDLRWLAIWGAAVFKEPAAVAVLRVVYGDEETREARLHADALESARLGLEDSFRSWTKGLGFDRARVRRPPFHVPAVVVPPGGEPDVTVLVPSYMHEGYVQECVRSVLAQTHPNHRILLVDDGSTDATAARAREIADERLEVRVRRQNLGLGPGLAEALAEVDTPFLAVLNSDDFFHPERLERCRRALLERPEAKVVATSVALVDAKSRALASSSVVPFFDGSEIDGWVSWYEKARKEAAGAPSLFLPLLRHNFLATSSNLFGRTEFFQEHRSVFRDLKYCVDWQLFLEAAAEDALLYVPEDLLAYRLHASNTVWFRGKERWRFLLEVNRVVGRGLRMLLSRAHARGEAVEESVERVLESLVERVACNEEADGFALFLDQFLGGVDLESVAARSPRVRELLGSLERRAADRREAGYLQADLGGEVESLLALRHEVPYLRILRNLAETTQDELSVRRGAEAFLRRYKDELERRAESLAGDLENERRLHSIEAAKLRARVVTLERDAASTLQVKEELFATRNRLEGEAEVLRADREHLESALAVETETRGVERRRHEDEIQKIRDSQEWKLGNLVWNRLRVGEFSRRGKKWLRHARDRRTRIALATGTMLRRLMRARDRSVVASCWSFPIYSHTFVYQEMLEMRKMGLGVSLFCWDTGPRRDLHPAFRYLWRNRVLVQADWWIQQKDLAYWRREHPERVDSLLALLSTETGRSVEDLFQDWLVLAGFTFARYLELSGARYLHSYFFYDQSFMAMMAGYLAGIPRGITAYADHMLSDYPLKCVRLNLELADVVVATSQRVRDELSGLTGGRFDEKIFVKPNGVDVHRFAFVTPEARAAENGVPEIAAVNRIEAKKGLVYLARAVRLLADRGLPVKLHLVGAVDPHNAGSREYAAELARTIRDLGIEDRVVMHGAKIQPEVISILSRARVFAAPYIETSTGDKDGIPTAMLEAMANGLPVVATDAGSIPEVVRDGVEAVCVPQRDPERLADAIERLLREPELGTRLSRAGRERVEAEFSTDATEGLLHRRIEAVLARRRGDGAAADD